MKKLIKIIAVSFLLCMANISLADTSHVITAEQQAKLTPQQVLEKLIAGNQRFLNDKAHHFDHKAIAVKTAKSQHPMAFVLSCIDSRGTPEVLFNQPSGNLFVSRIAGNVVDKKVLGGMEFATKLAGAKLIVVMGHTDCGAVRGACAGAKAGNLTHLLSLIKPAVSQIKASEKTDFNCNSNVTVDAIAKQNVLDQIARIKQHSKIIDVLVKEKKVTIVGAMHDLATGKVVFFDAQGKSIG